MQPIKDAHRARYFVVAKLWFLYVRPLGRLLHFSVLTAHIKSFVGFSQLPKEGPR